MKRVVSISSRPLVAAVAFLGVVVPAVALVDALLERSWMQVLGRLLLAAVSTLGTLWIVGGLVARERRRDIDDSQL